MSNTSLILINNNLKIFINPEYRIYSSLYIFRMQCGGEEVSPPRFSAGARARSLAL